MPAYYGAAFAADGENEAARPEPLAEHHTYNVRRNAPYALGRINSGGTGSPV